MLHAKFQDNMTLGTGREVFLKSFTIYGHGCRFGLVTQVILMLINVPSSQGGSI